MAHATRPTPRGERSPHHDGLGRRGVITDADGQLREVLTVVAELTAVPSFERALRERVSRLAAFRHPQVVPVLRVEGSPEHERGLTVVSERVEGLRLADFLVRSDAAGTRLDVPGALAILRSLLRAVVDMHEAWHGAPHGALGPERIIIANSGQVLVTEYVFGAALAQLQYSQERYWRDLRIALPRSAGLPRFDHRADVTQVAVVALSLLLGRPLGADEYPIGIVEALTTARTPTSSGGTESLPAPLRSWLVRALHLDARQAFGTALAALEALTALRLAVPMRSHQPGFLQPHVREAGDYRSAVTLTARPLCAVPPPELGLEAFPSEDEQLPESSATTTDHSALDDFSRSEDPCEANDLFKPTGLADEPRDVPRATEPTSRAEPDALPHVPDTTLFTSVAGVRRRRVMVTTVVAATLATAVLVNGVPARVLTKPAGSRTSGTVIITTVPGGAAAMLDGQSIGTTPLTVDVEAGTYTLELRGSDGRVRILPVRIRPGQQLEQYIEMGAVALLESTPPPRSQVATEAEMGR